jgi:hypothetical protein
MLNRRSLLMGAPLLASAPMLGLSSPLRILGEGAQNTSSAAPQLSPAVLAAVSSSAVKTADAAHRGSLTQTGLLNFSSMIDLLRKHFIEAGFDAAFEQYLRTVNSSQIDSARSQVIQSTYEAFAKADSTFTLGEVQAAFAGIPPAGQMQAQLQLLQTQGLTPSLLNLEKYLQSVMNTLPITYDRRVSPAHLRRANFCSVSTFVTSMLGAAAFSLLPGCSPEPFFEVICPAVGVLGATAGAVGIIVWIAC